MEIMWSCTRLYSLISYLDIIKKQIDMSNNEMIMNTNFIQMKTISVDKSKETSVAEVLTKWWNAKNLLFSSLTEESFSNREVVLAHLILIAIIICAAAIEVSLLVSFLSLLVAGGLVVYLNRADYNDNINIKKNIL